MSGRHNQKGLKVWDPEQRVAFLHARRDLKMARSAHAYVRGNTASFYEWLSDSSVAAHIPAGPAIWICGDCPLGNLGPISNSQGRVEIQIRDLDQAAIGNPAHDLIRLGLSLATAARGSDLPGVTTARMIEQMMEGYEQAIASPSRGDTGEEPDVVRTIRRRALGRRWRHLARERLEDVEPTIPLGKKFWALGARERGALIAAIASPAVRDMVLSLDGDGTFQSAEMVDAAYWMKGCSSLGLWRFAAIISRRGEEKDDHALIDLKEAVAPVAPVAPSADMPDDPGERVVAAAKALSPYLGSRIVSAKILGRSMFVRELMPQDLKIEVDQFTQEQAVVAARYLAYVIGKAHARQMDDAMRKDWLLTLQAGRSASLDAPSWLWRAIVTLAARHEAGYLNHCRLYASRMA